MKTLCLSLYIHLVIRIISYLYLYPLISDPYSYLFPICICIRNHPYSYSYLNKSCGMDMIIILFVCIWSVYNLLVSLSCFFIKRYSFSTTMHIRWVTYDSFALSHPKINIQIDWKNDGRCTVQCKLGTVKTVATTSSHHNRANGLHIYHIYHD